MKNIFSNKKVIIGIVVALVIVIIGAIIFISGNNNSEKDKVLLKCTYTDNGGEYNINRIVMVKSTNEGNILTDEISANGINDKKIYNLLDVTINSKVSNYDSNDVKYEKTDNSLRVLVSLNITQISDSKKVEYIGTKDVSINNLKTNFEAGGLICESY